MEMAVDTTPLLCLNMQHSTCAFKCTHLALEQYMRIAIPLVVKKNNNRRQHTGCPTKKA